MTNKHDDNNLQKKETLSDKICEKTKKEDQEELNKEIKKVLEEIENAIKRSSPNGDDEDFQNSIRDGVHAGVNANGGTENFNFYPSERVVPCQELCVGVAVLSFGAHCSPPLKQGSANASLPSKYGFKGLMIDIIKCWLKCFSTNKTTILITQDWNQKIFQDEWKSIIDTYAKTGNKKVYVIQVSSNDFLVHYAS